MSSMLLKPITLAPLKFTAEYRDETFFTWLPKVFQTTPPHPASNARSTFIFLSVGGADANQYGLGDLIPKKFADISAMVFYFLFHAKAVRKNKTLSSLHLCLLMRLGVKLFTNCLLFYESRLLLNQH